MEEISLGCRAACTSRVWENKIQAVVDKLTPLISVVFTDGSKAKDGRVAGGWAKDTFEGGPRDGGKYLGEGTTVWDGEITGMAEALGKGPKDRRVLILADSKVAIQAVKKAGRTGKVRTGELVRVIKEIKERQRMGHGVRLAWVKAHMGIPGNERVDERAKFFTSVVGLEVLTERGTKQQLTARRKEECTQTGRGKGRIARWSQRAATKYTHCWLDGKGRLEGMGSGDRKGRWGRVQGTPCATCLAHTSAASFPSSDAHVDLMEES